MKQILISALLFALTLASNSIFEKHQKEQNFLNFSKKHHKRYSNLEEGLYRFSVYKDNAQEIEKLNKQNPNASFGLNQFSDLTSDEFLAKFASGVKLPTDNSGIRKLDTETHSRILGSYPESLDLRTEKGMQPIRYQGSCGSCWAFSALSSLEYAYWKKTGISGDLSEQQLVDCVYSYSGCYGGWIPTAFEHIKKYGGIAWESDYEYQAKNTTCRVKELQSKFQVSLNSTKYYAKVASDDDSIKTALANVGVLSVCVDAKGWQAYEQGIYVDQRFENQSKQPSCTHGVNIVGYGTENDIPYYIVRNSWSTWWGEDGYMRMDARRHPNGNTYSGIILGYTYYPVVA